MSNYTGLEGLKGLLSLSEQERRKWIQHLIETGALKKGASLMAANRLYKNTQFAKMFGEDAFYNTSVQDRERMVKDKIVQTEFEKRYKNTASEEEWNLYNAFSTDGKLLMLENNLLTQNQIDVLSELRDKQKEEYKGNRNNWLRDAAGYMQEASALEPYTQHIKDKQDNQAFEMLKSLDVKKNNATLNLILNNERGRTLHEVQPLITLIENSMLDLLDSGLLTYQEVEARFDAIAKALPHYQAFKDEAVLKENFTMRDKIKAIAQVEAIALSGKNDILIINAVDRNIQDIIANNQSFGKKSELAIRNFALGTLGAIGSEAIGIISPFVGGFDSKRQNEFLKLKWVQWFEGLDTYNTWDWDEMQAAKENGGISPYQRISNSNGDRGIINTLMDMGAMTKFLLPALLSKKLGGMAGSAGRKYIMNIAKDIALKLPSRELQRFILGTGLLTTKGIDLATVFSSSAGISHMYSIGTYNESVEENKAKVQKAVENEILNIILKLVEKETSLYRFNSLEELDAFKAAKFDELLELYQKPENLEKIVLAARQNVNAEQLEEEGELAAARAYMINSTMEAIRMSAENAFFRRWMFSKGTKANLGLKLADLGVRWNTAKKGLNKFELQGKILNYVNPTLRNMWGGFESNYLDDVTARYAKEFGLADYNNYLMNNLTPQLSVGVTKELVNPFMEALGGAKEALIDPLSWWDGFIGLGGSVVLILPGLGGVSKLLSKQSIKYNTHGLNARTSEIDAVKGAKTASEVTKVLDNIAKKSGIAGENITNEIREKLFKKILEKVTKASIIEKVNDFVYNPIVMEMKDAAERVKEVEKDIENTIKGIELAKERGDFDKITNLAIAETKATNGRQSGNMKLAADGTTEAFYEVAKIAAAWEADPIASQHPEVLKNLLQLKRILEAKSIEDIEDIVGTASQRVGNKAGVEQSEEEFFQGLKSNVNKILSIKERYQEGLKAINRTLEGRIMDDELKDTLLKLTVMVDNWKERLKDITTKLQLSEEKVLSEREFLKYHSRKDLIDRINAQEEVIDKLEKDIDKSSNKNLKKDRKLRKKQNKEDRKEFIKGIGSYWARRLVKQLQNDLIFEDQSTLLRQRENNKKLLEKEKKKLDTLYEHLEKWNDNYKEKGQREVLSSSEILSLDIKDIGHMLANKSLYSEALQALLELAEVKLRERLNEEDRNSNILEMVADAAKLRDDITDTLVAYNRIWNDPEGAADWVKGVKQLRELATARYVIQSLMVEPFNNYDYYWQQVEEGNIPIEDFIYKLIDGEHTPDFYDNYSAERTTESSLKRMAILKAKAMLTPFSEVQKAANQEGIIADEGLEAEARRALQEDAYDAATLVQYKNFLIGKERLENGELLLDNEADDGRERLKGVKEVYQKLKELADERTEEPYAEMYNKMLERLLKYQEARENKARDTSIRETEKAEKEPITPRVEAGEEDSENESFDLEGTFEDDSVFYEEDQDGETENLYDEQSPEDPILAVFYANSGGKVSYAVAKVLNNINLYKNYTAEEKQQAIEAIVQFKDIKFNNIKELFTALRNTDISIIEDAVTLVEDYIDKILEKTDKQRLAEEERQNKANLAKGAKIPGRIDSISMNKQKKDHANGAINKYLTDGHHTEEFLEEASKTGRINSKTPIFFITDSNLAKLVRELMGDRYTEGDLPIIAVMEVSKNENIGVAIPITVDGETKYYQPVGIMPANNAKTAGSPHMEKVRELARTNEEGVQFVKFDGKPIESRPIGKGISRIPNFKKLEGKQEYRTVRELIDKQALTTDTTSKSRLQALKLFWKSLKPTKIAVKGTDGTEEYTMVMWQPEGSKQTMFITPMGMHKVLGGTFKQDTLKQHVEKTGGVTNFNNRLNIAINVLAKIFKGVKELDIPRTIEGAIDVDALKKQVADIGVLMFGDFKGKYGSLLNYITLPSGLRIKSSVEILEQDNGEEVPLVEFAVVNSTGEPLVNLSTVLDLSDPNTFSNVKILADKFLTDLIMDSNTGEVRMAPSSTEHSFVKFLFNYGNIETANDAKNPHSKDAERTLTQLVEDGILQVDASLVSLDTSIDRFSIQVPVDKEGKPTYGKPINQRHEAPETNEKNDKPVPTPPIGESNEKKESKPIDILEEMNKLSENSMQKMKQVSDQWDEIKTPVYNSEGLIVGENKVYKNKNTGEVRRGPTSIISKELGKKSNKSETELLVDEQNKELWLKPSTKCGNAVDSFGRDYFGERSSHEGIDYGSYPNATALMWQNLFNLLENIPVGDGKVSLKNWLRATYNIKSFHVTNISYEGTIKVKDSKGVTHEIPLVGSLDILAEDEQGNYYVIDIKTRRNKKGESPVTVDNLIYWTNQTRSYAKLVGGTSGSRVKGAFVLCVEGWYPQPYGLKDVIKMKDPATGEIIEKVLDREGGVVYELENPNATGKAKDLLVSKNPEVDGNGTPFYNFNPLFKVHEDFNPSTKALLQNEKVKKMIGNPLMTEIGLILLDLNGDVYVDEGAVQQYEKELQSQLVTDPQATEKASNGEAKAGLVTQKEEPVSHITGLPSESGSSIEDMINKKFSSKTDSESMYDEMEQEWEVRSSLKESPVNPEVGSEEASFFSDLDKMELTLIGKYLIEDGKISKMSEAELYYNMQSEEEKNNIQCKAGEM